MKLSQQQLLVLAAAELEEPFATEQLVVRAWQTSPQVFGLKGYREQYPDMNLVLTSLVGRRGLERLGYLTKVAPKTYRMTPFGRAAAGRIRAERAKGG